MSLRPALVVIALAALVSASAPVSAAEGLWRKLWPAPQQAAPPAPGDDAPRTRAEREAELREARVITSSHRVEDIQTRLRAGLVGADPTGRKHLDRVGSGTATVSQVNAFGIYLAERGLVEEALEYFRMALQADRGNANLWNNVGTVQLRLGEMDEAQTAFAKAISLDPNHALAHYNLGAVHDRSGDYDEAIEQYRVAFTLDPALADPTRNPQVVNNDHLTAVHLLLYQQKTGALGLPLVPLNGSNGR